MGDLKLYNAVKDQMQTGDIILWHSNSLLGALIREFSDAQFNHASLVIRIQAYEGTEGRRFLAEELRHGAVLTLLSKRLVETDGEAYWYPLNDDMAKNRAKIGENALKWIATPYNYEELVELAIKQCKTGTDAMICSEYCFVCLGYSGITPTPGQLSEMNLFKPRVRIL
jgi:hypothetical protein